MGKNYQIFSRLYPLLKKIFKFAIKNLLRLIVLAKNFEKIYPEFQNLVKFNKNLLLNVNNLNNNEKNATKKNL